MRPERKRRSATETRWAYLVRAGSEEDLAAELGGERKPRSIGEGVVLAEGRTKGPDGELVELAFARQAMRTDGKGYDVTLENLAGGLGAALEQAMKGGIFPWTLQVVAPDSKNPRDPRRRVARAIDEAIAPLLDGEIARPIAEAFVDELEDADRLAQVWIVDEARALIGVTRINEAISRFPAGRPPKTEDTLPSPIARKLKEAEAWLKIAPGRGEQVIALGLPAAGWAEVAAEDGAQVLLVDPKARASKGVQVANVGAFEFAPDETIDWLFVVLGHRPLEVTKLLAKWGRRIWAQQFVANLLLPMNTKAEFLKEALATLQEAGWRGLKARQLPSDKEEVTIYGWLDPALAMKRAKEPFRLRQNTGKEAQKLAKEVRKQKKKQKRKTTIKAAR